MLKAFVKRLVYRSYYLMKHQKRLLNRIKQRDHVVILSLHRVSPHHVNGAWPPLTPKIFDSLLVYLKKNFEIMTLHELEHVHTSKPKLVLSFDDGYYDFLEYAMPILQKHRLKANQNIIPSQLLNEKPLWNIALYDFINAAPASLLKELHLPAVRILSKKKTQIGLEVSRALKKLPFSERDLIINKIEKTLFARLEPYPKTRMLSLHDMNQVMAEHEIGVHSYSHNSMGQAEMDYFIEDFLKCQRFFAEHRFPKMDIYAFPNGSYRDEQIKYLQQNGIDHILLVGDKYANHQSPHHRLNIAAVDQYEAIFQSLGVKA